MKLSSTMMVGMLGSLWALTSGQCLESDQLTVAATVNDVPILIAEVRFRVQQSLGDREVSEPVRELLEFEALNWLIDQQKVLLELQRRGVASTPIELKVALQRLQADLDRQEKTLEDHCQTLQIPLEALERALRWQLSWKRCQEVYLTDTKLQAYFDLHRVHFDGTKMRVAQILLRSNEVSATDQLMQKAITIREEVLAKRLSFSDAARKYSDAPSAKDGGELGWISRDRPMPEDFSQCAFELDVGDVSQPIKSSFGVHLIQCLEKKPGQRSWQTAREALSEAMLAELFHTLANRAEQHAEVHDTGVIPQPRSK